MKRIYNSELSPEEQAALELMISNEIRETSRKITHGAPCSNCPTRSGIREKLAARLLAKLVRLLRPDLLQSRKKKAVRVAPQQEGAPALKRPIAVVFMIDPDKIPNYENVLPDVLSFGIEQVVSAAHPGGADTMMLRCFQFDPRLNQDLVEDKLQALSVDWKDWRYAEEQELLKTL